MVEYCNRFSGDFCLSVRPSVRQLQPSYAKWSEGRLRASTHLRYAGHKGIVVMLSPAQWCSSVQLLPVCIYMTLTSAIRLITILHVPCWLVVSAVIV